MSIRIVPVEDTIEYLGESIERVVEEDHRLEGESHGLARKLMEHRWHWTLDERNERRLTISVYAKHVGRSFTTIARNAKGYKLLVDNENAHSQDSTVHRLTPTDATDLALMSEDRRAATEAVSQARGISAVNARQHHAGEVRQVLAAALERAEENGTSVAVEAPGIAEMLVRAARSNQQHEEQRKKAHSFEFLKFDSQLHKALGDLTAAAKTSEGMVFNDDERDIVSHTLDKVRRLTDLMERSVVGNYGPDWGEKLRLVESKSTEAS